MQDGNNSNPSNGGSPSVPQKEKKRKKERKASFWERSTATPNGDADGKKERMSLTARLLSETQRRFSLGEQRKDKEKEKEKERSSSPTPLSSTSLVQPFTASPKDSHPPFEREESLTDLVAGGNNFLRALVVSFRKLEGANRQLCVVSKGVTAAATNTKKEELKVLSEQLVQARENLLETNTSLSEKLRRAARVQTHQVIMDLINYSMTVSNSASFLINCCKAVTIEVGDRELFKQALTATRTVRDALLLVLDALKEAPPQQQNAEMEKRLQLAAGTAKQSLWQLVTAQAAVIGENLISLVMKQEILAAVRAAVSATTKLVWVRCTSALGSGGDMESIAGGGEIVEATKVAATTVSQLCAALLEASNTDLMLAHPPYQQLLLAAIDRLKVALAHLIEETRTEIFVDPKKMSPAYEEMREAIVNSTAVTDLLSQQSLEQLGTSEVPSLTKKHLQDALKIVEANTPPQPPQPPAPSAPKSTGEGEKGGGKDEGSEPAKDASLSRNIWEEPPDCPENVIFRDDDPTRIRCANLNKLVEKLTPPGSPDMRMIKTLVTTYQSFTTTHDLLNKLIERFEVPPEQAEIELPVQLRVCNVVRLWVESYLDDFNATDIKILSNFVEKKLTQNATYEKYVKKILLLLSQRRASTVRETVRKGLFEIKIEPKIPLSPAKVLSVFDELQIARQLTLVEFKLYQAIRPAEFLNQAWNKAKLKYRAPNLLRLIARSTALSFWVASCILWQSTLRDRIRVLTKMINIAEHLRKMNNFNSLMALIAGINMASIYRLKHTRDGVPAQTMKTFEACEALMSSNQAFQNYRKELHNINPPCVPFVGVYLTDLTFSDDAKQDYIDGLINFGKWELIYSTISEIQTYQQTPYDFEYVDHIASFLSELPYNTEADMFELSKFYEPKDSLLADIL